MINSIYVDWLKKQNIQLYRSGNTLWRKYQGALIPAPAAPCFISLEGGEAKSLLKESEAWLLRYSSNPCNEETEWWYIICDSYSPDKLSSNARNQIKRANRKCFVQMIDAEWLAQNGYECYSTAYARYNNAKSVEADAFSNGIRRTVGGPFEYWGVFVDDSLAGYCQCIVENNDISTNVMKYHPSYLKYYTSYALITSMINYYVTEKGKIINNGSRSIAHDTNIQDLLLKLGFRRQFCRLNVEYQPWLKVAIQTFFPLRKLIGRLPRRGSMHKLQALLHLEELRRRSY